MSRIETSLALPVFHDRVPVRGAPGGFLGQLQAPEAKGAETRDGLPLLPDCPATMLQEQCAADHPGPAADLYALAALSLHHLSYRIPPPAPVGTPAAEAGPACVFSSYEPAAPAVVVVTAGASVRATDAGGSVPVRSTHAQSGDEASTDSSATAEARERLAASWLRKLRCYEVPGGVELVLRDYESVSGGDLLPALLDYCRRQDIVLVRIVLNGHVVWSHNQPGQR